MSNIPKTRCTVEHVVCGMSIWVKNALLASKRTFASLGWSHIRSFLKFCMCIVGFVVLLPFLFLLVGEIFYLPGLLVLLVTDAGIKYEDVSLFVVNADKKLFRDAFELSTTIYVSTLLLIAVGVIFISFAIHLCDLGKAENSEIEVPEQ